MKLLFSILCPKPELRSTVKDVETNEWVTQEIDITQYKWENVTVKTKIKKQEKFLLDDISGSVKTGEALAIIGGSGAGNLYK